MTQDSQQGPRQWHAMPADEVLREFDSDADGLTQAEAGERLRRHGPNALPAPARRHPLQRLLLQFHNILIYVLLGSALITVLLGHAVDAAVIMAVVLVNAVIGFLQEGKAERALDAIRQMLAPGATVLRDGQRRDVPGESLVPGDLVLLEAGDRVPADLRLYKCKGLRVQEAILTGESVPVEKRQREVEADALLGDRGSMAFSGTLVTTGTGTGIVVATGAATELGRISGMLSEVETITTPLLRQMDHFARLLTFVILGIALFLIGYGYLAGGYDFSELFMAVVGLSVAAIPEGLPAVLTITLAVGVQAMAKRNAIVRRLPAIETLGAVSVICTDKTGTLTRNEMMVASVHTPGARYRVTGEGYEPSGGLYRDEDGAEEPEQDKIEAEAGGALAELARIGALCNDARLVRDSGAWRVEGDPMEGALHCLAEKLGLPPREAAAQWTRTDAIPFDSDYRYMATLHHDHDGHAFIAVKGAPEQVLRLCGRQRGEADNEQELDAEAWLRRVDEIAARGQRVLALACKPVAAEQTVLEHADVAGDLVLLGLVGLIDPPRQEAVDAVAECLRAGIDVKMITGDHRGTAVAIAREIGLRNPEAALEGSDLDRMDEGQLARAVVETDVFARTSPEHKLRLVTALQSHELIVAMTGDGVNDAPALKRADAGIAMGCKGSEAAKEAAVLVLADDNFASIAAAVVEGRTVYDNIKKVISWTLPTSTGEALVVIVALLLGLTLPITPIQILWINLITTVTLGLALAFDPSETNLMRRPPRSPGAALLSRELLWHIALVSLLFLAGVFGIYSYSVQAGHSLELTRTMAVSALVVMESFHLLFIRNLYGTTFSLRGLKATPVVWGTVVAVLLAQTAMVYTGPLQQLFETRPMEGRDIAVIFALGFALLLILEAEKLLRSRLLKLKRG